MHAVLFAAIGGWGIFAQLKPPRPSGAPGTQANASEPIGVALVGAPKPARVQSKRASNPDGDVTSPAQPAQTAADESSGAAASAEKKSPSPGAPDSSESHGASAQYAEYTEALRARVASYVRYPLSARRRGLQGRVGLSMALDSAGRITRLDVAESSGSRELDELALEAARASQPLPSPPSATELHLPIEFKLK